MATTSAKELFELYNPGLLACLPMKDITFLEVLKGKGLLPDDVRSSLEEMDETTERSSYFLERMIKAAFDDENDSHFINLLAAMMECSHDNVKDVAIEMQNKLGMDSHPDYDTVSGMAATDDQMMEVVDKVPDIAKQIKSTSAKESFELYYPRLLVCLPMKDITFLEVLKQMGLLPDDTRSSLEQMDETTERSSYFLERMIKTAFDDDNDSHFINLLAAMMESSRGNVKDLAIEMQKEIDLEVPGMAATDDQMMEVVDKVPDVEKQIKSTSAKELFELYNPRLLVCLPMKDITFLEVLKQKGLLPDDTRSSLEQMDETTERSSYFLERMIKTAFDDDNDSHFINLLAAMMESSHDNVKDLAIEMQKEIDLEVPDTDQYGMDEVDVGTLDVIPDGKTRDDKPIMNDLHTKVIHKQFAVHWKRLGLKLGLSNDRMEIISYNHTHSPNRAQDCCIAMFEEWLRDVPSPTWGLLSDCIIEIMTGDDINISTSVAYRTINEVIEHYKTKYIDNNRFSTDYNYTLCQTRMYIDLVFMIYNCEAKKTQADSSKITKIQFGGNTDIDETIYFSNVFKKKELDGLFELNDKFIYIFEGAPGIGKTVVAQQIAYEWASNKILPKVELLLLLYFRDPKLQKVCNFTELMEYCKASICKSYFNEKDGKNLMLVFDGYDELPKDAIVHSLFKDLLRRNILSCCSIAFTSRPHNTVDLHHYCDHKIEILGFAENDRFNFLTKNNVSDDNVDKIRTFLQENLIINSLCYIPFNMASLLLLLTENKDLPKTQTDLPKTQIDLTRRAITTTISYHIKKSSKNVNITKEDRQVKNIMDSLAPLAFTMIKQEKLVLSKAEINSAGCKAIQIDKNAYGLIQMVQFTDSEASIEVFYNFVHFSVQEYLAAYHLSQRFSIAQSFFLHYNFWDLRYFGVWKMYAGITQGKKFPLQHFLSGENYFKAGIRFLIGHEFPGVSKVITVKKVYCLLLYQMFLEVPESPVKESLSSVVTNDTINLCDEILSSCDVGLLTYCITRSYMTTNWKMINLSHCKIDDGKCGKLFQGLSLDDYRQKPTIDYLDLSHNYITLDDFFCENIIHGNPAVIHCLNISNNSISNFALLDNLVRVHNITTLYIHNNVRYLEMIEENDMININNNYSVQWTLPSLSNLHTLDMRYCSLKVDSEPQAHDNNTFPSLQKLILSHCHLSGESIANLLCALPKTVQLLDLSHTRIDDQGVTSLQEFFHHNDDLQNLSLVAVGLTGVNILTCVQALRGCKKLELLDISENDITDEEAESVVRLCQEIPSLKELKLKNISITQHILRHADKFSIRNYRDPIKRKILVVGMEKTGKSTLIRKLIDEDHHDTNTNPFQDTVYKPTTAVQPIIKTLFINGKFYKCTFIDTPGLPSRAVTNYLQHLTDELSLILFVFQHGRNSTEAILCFTNILQGVTCQSVAVIITFCDTLNDEDYKDIKEEFMSSCDTMQFSSGVGKAVYPIGFPSKVASMDERAGELSSKFIQKNVSKLQQLIVNEPSSDHIPAQDATATDRSKTIKCSVM